MFNIKCPPDHTKNLLKILSDTGPIAKLSKNKKAIALGADGEFTVQKLWEKYTGKHWMPEVIHITRNDVGRFNRGVNEFLKDLGKTQNMLSSLLKLPKVLASKLLDS